MNVKWWIGVVENEYDPESRGRIQVRILGIHTNETRKLENMGYGIPISDLPWATCMMPLTYGGIAESTLPPPAVCVGAWVMGVSLDGDAYQKLIVLGVISLSLSPLSTHNGADLGAARAREYEEEVIDEMDTCDDSYAKALKNLTSDTSNKTTANNMLLLLKYLKQNEPQKYNNFVKTSGLELTDNSLSDETTNDSVNAILAEGYYNYCLDVCSDPVLAALSYKSGLGKAVLGYNGEKSFVQKYGDPRKKEISYADLANRISQEEPDSAKFMTDFIAQLGESCMNRCVYGIGQSSATQNYTSSSEGVTISTNTSKDLGLTAIALPTDSNVITSKYLSKNRPSYGSKVHLAIDLKAPSGSPIRAMADGEVVSVIPNWGGVLIDHGFGLRTRYLHMRKTYVKVGSKVKIGEQIGESGNVGLPQSDPHLHFEVWKNNTKINPETFFAENGIITTLKPGA